MFNDKERKEPTFKSRLEEIHWCLCEFPKAGTLFPRGTEKCSEEFSISSIYPFYHHTLNHVSLGNSHHALTESQSLEIHAAGSLLVLCKNF